MIAKCEMVVTQVQHQGDKIAYSVYGTQLRPYPGIVIFSPASEPLPWAPGDTLTVTLTKVEEKP